MLFGIGVTIMRPGPVASAIWADSMAAGAGCWTAQDDSDWGGALARSRRYLGKQWQNAAWFLPATAVSRAAWRVLSARTAPATHVVTPNWLENWLLPMFMPTFLVDAAVRD